MKPLIERLDEMTEKAKSAWPSLSDDKIEKAIGYIFDGEVNFTGNLPVTGIDDWNVDGHHCSHAGQQCDCRETGIATKIGMVCSHRLAVMFRMRLDAQVMDELKAAYESAGEDVGRVVIFADVYFGQGIVGGDRWLLKGWRVNGHGTTTLDYDSRVDLTEEKLGSLLREVGWTMTGKQQQGGYTYHAYTERMDGYHERQQPEVDTGVGRLKGMSPYAQEMKQDREKFSSLFTKALNENMEGATA